jgi:sugar/nucleoside kinase (ribokinase family)
VLHHQAAYAVRALDTTGAGDVFHGAYTLAIAEGSSVARAMRFAAAAAALKCARGDGGRGCPRRAEVESLLTGD